MMYFSKLKKGPSVGKFGERAGKYNNKIHLRIFNDTFSLEIKIIMSECEGKDYRTDIEDNFLTCPVCYDHFNEDGEITPKVLGCGHTLCRRCINHIYCDTKMCPFCKYQMDFTPDRCPKNFMIIGMLSFFPKVREPIRLLKFAESDIEAARNKVYDTCRAIEHYSQLIAAEEANLQRLRALEAEARTARSQSETEVDELTHTIARLHQKSESTEERYEPIQCQFVSHPPPLQPIPMQPDPWTSRVNLLYEIQGHRGRRAQAFQEEEPGYGTNSLSVFGELQRVLTARRRVNQPVVQVPEREQGVGLETSLSELQRVFSRRQNGLNVRESVA